MLNSSLKNFDQVRQKQLKFGKDELNKLYNNKLTLFGLMNPATTIRTADSALGVVFIYATKDQIFVSAEPMVKNGFFTGFIENPICVSIDNQAKISDAITIKIWKNVQFGGFQDEGWVYVSTDALEYMLQLDLREWTLTLQPYSWGKVKKRVFKSTLKVEKLVQDAILTDTKNHVFVKSEEDKKQLAIRSFKSLLLNIFGQTAVAMEGRKPTSSQSESTRVIDRELAELISGKEEKEIHFCFKNNQAYILTRADVENTGLYLLKDPIRTVNLDVTELAMTLREVLIEPYQTLSDEEIQELIRLGEKGDHPIQKITHSTSWQDLYQTAIFYVLHIRYDRIRDVMYWLLDLHTEVEGSGQMTFPIETPLEKLVTVILDHVQQFPRVLKERKRTRKKPH